MRLLVNSAYSSSMERLRSIAGASRFLPIPHYSRRVSSDHSASSGSFVDSIASRPGDINNRIRVIGSTIGVIGAAGMLFDTFYRRTTKQELNQAFDKLDAKIDREMGKIDSKIESLTHALLHTNQRDRIAAETEVRELRLENERLRGKTVNT